MKREYTNEDFCQVVDFLKSKIPAITIATDIIAGFPTETEEDFIDTLELIRKYQFPSLFINQYFPRPGTPAAKLTRIPADQVKKRTKVASDLFQTQFPYFHKLGEVQDILVTEVGTFKFVNFLFLEGQNYSQFFQMRLGFWLLFLIN